MRFSSPAPALVLVASVAENGVIGQGGGLPWRLKSDLQHFRAVTLGKPVVMGRKTFLSVGKPLAGRTNIVISRNRDFAAPGAVVAPDIARALAVAHGDALRRGAATVTVIGGAALYAATIGTADRLVITRVHLRPEGDTFFPAIDPVIWQETSRSRHDPGPDDAAAFTVLVYVRRASPIAEMEGSKSDKQVRGTVEAATEPTPASDAVRPQTLGGEDKHEEP